MKSNHTFNSPNQISLLQQTLKPHLRWHGARLNFLALFLVAILRVKTVNLAELATSFRSNAKTESSYKRLQRFFRHFELDYQAIAQIVSALRLDNGELLIVITPEPCSTTISDYGKRWGSETWLGMFKTRGFCLESTHFRDSERLSKLIALMTLACSTGSQNGRVVASTSTPQT